MTTEKATKLIPNLGQGLVTDVKYELKKRLDSRKPEPTGTYKGAQYYRLGDTQNGYYVLTEDDEVVYFLRYKEIKHNGFKLGRQILVWRQKGSVAAAGFARFIFFKKLMPNYHALVADQLQTDSGMQFWVYSADYAFENGYNVYFLDRRNSPNTLTKIEDSLELKKYSSALWGKSEGHKFTFLVISDRVLSLKSKQ